MAISDFPTALQPIIQQGFLARRFERGLRSELGYRSVADREPFPNKIGETITKTRTGLKAPVTTPLDPTQNTNLDNGLTSGSWSVEQYTLSIAMYGDTIDLNTVTEGVGIARQFVVNADVNGTQARQSLDRIARQVLFAAYMGGNTWVNATLGSNGAAITVDDITGFTTVFVTGGSTALPVAISSGNPLPVLVNGVAANCISAVADGTNVSKNAAAGGKSGTLTMSASVLIANGTLGNTVTSTVGPTIVRPNGRASTYKLQSGDNFSMSVILDAVAVLRNNAVPPIDGRYNCFIDPTSARQLFGDSEFQLLYRGTGDATRTYKTGQPVDILDVRFLSTTEAYLSAHPTIAGAVVHRPIVVGKGALIEGDFTGITDKDTAAPNSEIEMLDGVAMVTRAPLDRLQQIIAQSWYWIGGFCVPTDITATQTIIPTANTSYYKRAVIIEHI